MTSADTSLGINEMTRTSERGGARLKFIIVVAIIGIVAYAGYQFIPVFYQAYQIKDLMKHEVDAAVALNKPTSWITEQLVKSAFGRTLTFGSAELQRWLERPAIVRLGIAGFADVARASRQAADGRTPVQVDLGAGLRIKIPGTPGVLRADVAHGLRDGANALTFGWLFKGFGGAGLGRSAALEAGDEPTQHRPT